MSRKRPLSSRSVEKLSERERNAGLDPDDAASLWLERHDPRPLPPVPKRASKNKVLHQWRKRHDGNGAGLPGSPKEDDDQPRDRS